MSTGKIIAQCGHAVEHLVLSCPRPLLNTYRSRACSRKVSLGVPGEKELDELAQKARDAGILSYKVRDAGLTQVEAGTTTVLGIGPVRPTVVQDFLGGLKLL